MVKAMVGGCCVCSDERGWDENPLVYCDGHGCNVAVHQACYGIVQVPKGPWFCRKCESQERIARVKCELCPSKTGALKRTDTGGWAHVVCALYIPEVRFGNVTTMEPIILASVPHERYLKMCYICEERGKESKTAHGGCMNCNKQGCRQTFHVTCAQSCGFLCEENDGQSGHTVKYVGYCQFHWNKRNKGLLNIKTPEKEKLKLKWEKEKKLPKPRTSSESQSPSGSQSQKPDATPKSSSSIQSSSSIPSTPPVPPTAVTALPGTPKPRGRKPSTVKTLPMNASGSSTTTSISASEKESSGVVLSSPAVSTAASPVPPVAVASIANTLMISPSSTITGSTESIFAPIPTTSKDEGQVNSKNNVPVTSHNVAQPTPTPPPVSAPMSKTVTQPKPAVVKKAANQTKNSQGPRKRPSSKTDDEPKRKVGRPPLKNKGTESKPKISKPSSTPKVARPSCTQKVPRPHSTPRQSKSKSQNKSQEMKGPVINSPTPVNLSSSYPGYPMSSMAEMSSSSLVSVPSGMPPASSHGVTPYVIPQPHLAGQLENGYSSQESNRRTTNGPLQLPSSLEQLLEYQWEQGAQFLMQQASQYDVASLMSSLHQLKADNTRLENRLDSLVSRRSQLLQVSSRLSAPMSCTPTNTSTTSTDTSNREPTGTRTTSSVTQSIPTATSTRTSTASTSDSIEKSSPSVSKPEPVIATLKSQTPPSSTNGTPAENKPTSAKTKNDKGKSPPIKVTTTAQNASGTLLTLPITSKMVPQKSVNLQPSQIKVSMVQPRVTQGVADKDKHKVASTAPPIAILPTISNPLLQKQQLQLLQPQTKQITQSKTTKQPHILPHQTLSSQAFAAQQFPQQQSFVLLMQQQQQQQHLQQHLQRQGQGAYQSGQNQLASSQAQTSKGTASQKFVPTLGYQGGFVTISDGVGIAGQPIDVSKATAFATLPLVQLGKNKANDHSDKNGTPSTSDKSLLKNS